MRLKIVFSILIILVATNTLAATVTVTTGTKSPGDFLATDDVVIDGTVSFNAGVYSLKSLTINAAKTLTVLSNTATNSGVIINAQETVSVLGTISANGTGFTGGSGPGTGLPGTYGSGAGYGGRGATSSIEEMLGGPVYGSAQQPTALGSGGGGSNNSPTAGGAGGGAIKIVCDIFNLSGSITSNGNSTAVGAGGGGSGGSVWIIANTLSGAGSIQVNGGSSSSGASAVGGGGRIAIEYFTAFTLTGTMQAAFASGSATSAGATPGTILVIDRTNNDLYLSYNSSLPQEVLSFRNILVPASVTVTVAGQGYAPTQGPGAGTSANSASGGGHGGRGGTLNDNSTGGVPYGSTQSPTEMGSGGGNTLTGGGSLGGFGGGAIKWIASGTITVNGTLSANGGNSISSTTTGGGAGGSIWLIASNFAGSGVIQANGGNSGGLNGGVGGGGRIALYYSNTYNFSGTLQTNTGTSGQTNGATLGSIIVVNSAQHELLFPVNSSVSNGAYYYRKITIPNSVTVNAGDGYSAAKGPGAGGSGSTTAGGGGYGGTGGAGSSEGAGGITYGSSLEPVDLGSGGGTTSGTSALAGSGGGAIKFLVSDVLTLGTSSVLSADGSNALGKSGSGSGGSIWIITNKLESGGTIRAAGGSGSATGGGGGGGRIRLIYSDSTSGAASATLTAPKGTGGTGSSTVGTTIKTLASTASALVFITPPSNTASVNTEFLQQPIVGVVDANGDLISTYTGPISLEAYSNATCTAAAPGVLSGSADASSGAAVYSGVKYSVAGIIYLKAVSSGLTSTCSSAITLASGISLSLIFSTQPSARSMIKKNLSTQPVVAAVDGGGVTVVSFTETVTLSPYKDSSCTIPSTGTLSGSSTTNSGIAAFFGVKYSKAESIYIKATSATAGNACSNKIRFNLPFMRPRGF